MGELLVDELFWQTQKVDQRQRGLEEVQTYYMYNLNAQQASLRLPLHPRHRPATAGEKVMVNL